MARITAVFLPAMVPRTKKNNPNLKTTESYKFLTIFSCIAPLSIPVSTLASQHTCERDYVPSQRRVNRCRLAFISAFIRSFLAYVLARALQQLEHKIQTLCFAADANFIWCESERRTVRYEFRGSPAVCSARDHKRVNGRTSCACRKTPGFEN